MPKNVLFYLYYLLFNIRILFIALSSLFMFFSRLLLNKDAFNIIVFPIWSLDFQGLSYVLILFYLSWSNLLECIFKRFSVSALVVTYVNLQTFHSFLKFMTFYSNFSVWTWIRMILCISRHYKMISPICMLPTSIIGLVYCWNIYNNLILDQINFVTTKK